MSHQNRIKQCLVRGTHVELDEAGAILAISPSQGGVSALVYSTAGGRRLGTLTADSADELMRQAQRRILAGRLRNGDARARSARGSVAADLRWLRSFRGLFNAAGQPINIERHY